MAFSVAKIWPPSVEWFFQYHWKGCKCLVRQGHLERKTDAVVSVASSELAFTG